MSDATQGARVLDGAPQASRRLFQAAFTLFTITVGIGILNGTDLVDFDRNTLLAHVHAGTLGWITLGVTGAAIWMFRGRGGLPVDPAAEQRLAVANMVAVGLYVIAFWTGALDLRPVTGTLMLLAILWTAAWIWQRRAHPDVARIGMLLAFVSLIIGAVFGILLGLAMSGRADWLPSQLADAHPPTMVIGYLIMAALAIAEWRLAPSTEGAATAGRAGIWQVWLVFSAGVVLLVGLIVESQPLLILSQPLELAGIVIFLTRMRHALRGVEWRRPDGGRTYTAAIVFLALNIVLLLYVVANYADDPDAIPMNTILAIDHLMFVGAMTNVLIGLAIAAAPERRIVPSADDLVFWTVNGGLALFALGLLADTVWLKRLGTPFLGLGLLLAIGVHIVRLAQVEPEAPAQTAVATGTG